MRYIISHSAPPPPSKVMRLAAQGELVCPLGSWPGGPILKRGRGPQKWIKSVRRAAISCELWWFLSFCFLATANKCRFVSTPFCLRMSCNLIDHLYFIAVTYVACFFAQCCVALLGHASVRWESLPGTPARWVGVRGFTYHVAVFSGEET